MLINENKIALFCYFKINNKKKVKISNHLTKSNQKKIRLVY